MSKNFAEGVASGMMKSLSGPTGDVAKGLFETLKGEDSERESETDRSIKRLQLSKALAKAAVGVEAASRKDLLSLHFNLSALNDPVMLILLASMLESGEKMLESGEKEGETSKVETGPTIADVLELGTKERREWLNRYEHLMQYTADLLYARSHSLKAEAANILKGE